MGFSPPPDALGSSDSIEGPSGDLGVSDFSCGRGESELCRRRGIVDEDPMHVGREPSRSKLLRFARRGDLGKLVVMLALVALRKLEFAALRNVVGKDRNMRCE